MEPTAGIQVLHPLLLLRRRNRPYRTVLRLTANQGGWATSAWYQTPQVVANGFTTTFSFQLGSTSTYNADGFAFVIQNSSLSALGAGGCGIGFGGSSSGCASSSGIANSVAIEFNTYPNGAGVDPSSDDVTIQNCGGITPNSVDSSCSLKYNDLTGKINLTDGNVHVAAITYTPSDAIDVRSYRNADLLDPRCGSRRRRPFPRGSLLRYHHHRAERLQRLRRIHRGHRRRQRRSGHPELDLHPPGLRARREP